MKQYNYLQKKKSYFLLLQLLPTYYSQIILISKSLLIIDTWIS
jgi:hypothetical protein